jgi:hypothetical protein
MPYQRAGDPTPPIGWKLVRRARRLWLKPVGGWHLEMRIKEHIGPFVTLRAARAASEDLNQRLRGVDAAAAVDVIQKFIAHWIPTAAL